MRSPYKRALALLATIGVWGLSGCSDDGTGPGDPASVIITGPSSARQGDVTAFTAEARDASGTLVNEPSPTWSVEPSSAGLITEEGEFVGYASGSATIVVSVNGVSDVLQVTIDTRALSGSFGLVGRGIEVGRFTSGSSPELCVKVRGSSSMLLLGCLGDLLRFEKREIQVATFAPDRSSP